MKLLQFCLSGRTSWGVLTGTSGVVDLGARLPQYSDLRALLQADDLGAVRALASCDADYDIGDLRFRPVIHNPDKVICVGLNYGLHIQETGRATSEKPVLFLRLPSTQIGHGQPVLKPRNSDQLDYEGELAVVVGRAGRYIPEEKALDHIAGYSCYNDLSVRDWQFHTHQYTPGKNFPTTGPFGPWLVTPDEIDDLAKLSLTTKLNGDIVQHASIGEMVFSIPFLLAYVSSFVELLPGDVLVTGTPGGVGFKRNPPLLLQDGDVVDVEISGVGVLSNPIQAELS